jgi:hypothetical protein
MAVALNGGTPRTAHLLRWRLVRRGDRAGLRLARLIVAASHLHRSRRSAVAVRVMAFVSASRVYRDRRRGHRVAA